MLSPDDAVADIAALRGQDGGDLVIWGSASLVTTLLAEGLVDELNLMIEPILLGGGKRIFPEDGAARPMQLVRCVTRRHGCAGLHVPPCAVIAATFSGFSRCVPIEAEGHLSAGGALLMETLRAEARDEYRSLFDPLTGLPKRPLLHDRLAVALGRATRVNSSVGLISISVSFDTLRSNQAKAKATLDIAVRLASLLRADDTAARIEDACAFIVVCNVVADERDLESIASRIAFKLSEPLAFDLEPVEVTVAISSTLACIKESPAALLDAAVSAALAL